MGQKSTLNKLLQYHYDELSLLERISLEEQLKHDESLKKESDEIELMKSLLDTSFRKPSDSSIRIIMDYNRNKKSQGELEVC
jgi:hypothetical protein